jgi:hypothetical protein
MKARPTCARSATLGKVFVTLALCATLAACGGNPAPTGAPAGLSGALSAAGPLLGSIGTAVPGLSQAQSILGVGSLLGLAKAKMPAAQFSQIGAAIPGSDALLGEAVKQGLPSTLGSLSDVTGFLGKSGISASQVNQMIPVVGQALSGKVSPDLATSFLSALK